MKVGLVPLLYKEYNYGGILQFYALQQILKKNNIETEIIYFENDDKVIQYNMNAMKRAILKIQKMIISCVNRKNIGKVDNVLKLRKDKIDKFREDNFSLVKNENDIDFYDYNAIICGSDQIWNPAWARRRSFLEFVPDNINKIIYAASLGCEVMTAEEKRIYKLRIERLQYISVREFSGKKILDSFIENKKIEVVLDPTLLLLKNEWENIVKKSIYKDYILTYFLGEYSDKTEYIKKIAKEKNLKVINIPYASGEKIDNNKFGDIEIIDADPGEFLGLIKDASYIFTDSFHACVFSVIFEKEFFVFRRGSMFGRIQTLIENFKLPKREITTNDDINKFDILKYEDSVKIQKDLRKKSLEYLFRSINNGKCYEK